MDRHPLVPRIESERPVVSRPFEFTWEVPVKGFAWVFGRTPVEKGPRWLDEDSKDPSIKRLSEESEWALVPADNFQVEMRPTRPLSDHPTLFRKFASLNPDDRDAILGFANAHGPLLRVGESLYFDPPPTEPLTGLSAEQQVRAKEYLAGREELAPALTSFRERLALARCRHPNAEVHDTWAWAIREMALVTRLWEAVAARDLAGVSELVTIRTDRNGSSWHILAQSREAFFGRVRGTPAPEEAFAVALRYITMRVDGSLWRKVSPSLQPDSTRGSRPTLRLYPDDLESAMWLQLAQAVAGNKEYRQCRCGVWFEMSADEDARTTRRLFCSDPCKSRDYRRRKDLAAALKAEGKSVAEIAAEIDTDVDTVNRWVGTGTKSKRKGD